MNRIIILTVLLLSGTALACDCVSRGTPEEHIANTEIIAYGRNLDARVLSQGEHEKLFQPGSKHYIPETLAVASFEIEIPIKGAVAGDVVSVYYDVDGTDCSMAPSVGQSHILFIDKFEGQLFGFSCANEWSYPQERREQYFRIFEEISDFDWPYN
jgi:hypothetical protein